MEEIADFVEIGFTNKDLFVFARLRSRGLKMALVGILTRGDILRAVVNNAPIELWT